MNQHHEQAPWTFDSLPCSVCTTCTSSCSHTRLWCCAPTQDYTLFAVEISASYTTSGPNNNWHDDLKRAIRHAGERKRPSVFLFSDAQIVDETMVRGAACQPLRVRSAVCVRFAAACLREGACG